MACDDVVFLSVMFIQEAKQKTLNDKDSKEQSEELLASEFETGLDYDLRLRCKILETEEYHSQWSEWSSELRIPALGTINPLSLDLLN